MPNPIKRIRNRIWIIIGVSFFIITVCTMLILYTSSNQRLQNDSYQRLYSAFVSSELHIPNHFFSAKLNTENDIVDIISDFDLVAEEYDIIAGIVVAQPDGTGVISLAGERWIYAFAPNVDAIFFSDTIIRHPDAPTEYCQRIIFVNISILTQRHEQYVQKVIYAAAISYIVCIILGFFIAMFFTRPTKKSFEAQQKVAAEQKRFAADTTHELKTPMAMIKGGFDEILRNKDQTIESQMKWFEMIEFGNKRMENLINELLVLARIENPEFEMTGECSDIADTSNRIISIMQVLANKKGVLISKKIDPDIDTCVNKDLYMQVLMIFMENAVKYVDENGSIAVSLSQDEEWIEVAVQNSGVGIPEDALPQIFERFYRANSDTKKGSGLGLAIAKEIMTQLGGHLTVESVVGEVTTVKAYFPRL